MQPQITAPVIQQRFFTTSGADLRLLSVSISIDLHIIWHNSLFQTVPYFQREEQQSQNSKNPIIFGQTNNPASFV